MASSFISLLALYREDSSIFNMFSLPDKMTNWRTDLIDSLMMDTAELEVIYPNVEFMRHALGLWSRRNAYNWGKLYDTLYFEYNPIWNKDGTVTVTTEGSTGNTRTYNRDGTDTRNIDTAHKGNTTNNSTTTLSENGSTTENRNATASTENSTTNSKTSSGSEITADTLVKSSSETTDNYVVGYNTADKTLESENTKIGENKDTDSKTVTSNETENANGTEKGKTTEQGSTTGTNTKSSTGTGTETGQDTSTDNTVDKNVSKISDTTNDTGTSTGTEQRIEQGNIGVTTTQSMIQEERELVKFNLIDYIVTDFKNRFCVLIY